MTYDTIIIGGGVSGMTTALYLKKAGLNCLIIESSTPGGVINYAANIENYPGYSNIIGSDLAYKIYDQLLENNIEFKFEEVLEITTDKVKKVITKNNVYETSTIVIATGRKHKDLNVLNEEKLQNKGISYCAVCDGGLYKNKDVCVIGGGSTALQGALYLKNICNKVTLINRSNNFRGEKTKLDKLREEKNVTILENEEIREFVEDKDKNNLSGIITKKDKKILCDGAFICIGYIPNTDIFKNLDILNNLGYVIVDMNMKTKIDNIYAIGDVRENSKNQIVSAMSDGVIAALDIINNKRMEV